MIFPGGSIVKFIMSKRTITMPIDSSPQNLNSSLRMPTIEWSTPFVGRQVELGQLHALLTHSHTRLVTILGPGGMGCQVPILYTNDK